MRKTLLTLAALALMLTSARASEVINATNFPDEMFRQRIAEAEWDKTATERSATKSWRKSSRIARRGELQGTEHFTSLATLWIGRWDMEKGEDTHATNPDLSPLQQLWRFGFGGYDNTSVDVSVCKNVTDVEIADCPNLTSFKAPAGVEVFTLTDLPSLTTFDFSIYKKLKECFFRDLQPGGYWTSSNHPAIVFINVSGSEENPTHSTPSTWPTARNYTNSVSGM